MKKQIFSTIAICFLLLLMSSIFKSCINVEPLNKATIETCQVTSITAYSAISGGVISADGGSNVTARGVCWCTSPNPTIENDTTIDAAGTGSFTSLLKGLSPSTSYYVRAYAVSKGGIGYGLQICFTTNPKNVIDLVTTVASEISSYTASSGGTISSDGGTAVTARGVCWSTSSAPTIANSKTDNGTGIGSYTSSITGLTPNTTYYIRSYAKNIGETSYGNEVSFTSTSTVTDLSGNVYTTLKIGTQVWMVENLKTTKFNDGTNIPNITDAIAWITLTTPGYCFYNNDASKKSTYGALYNWYSVNTGKLAPTGWHVPTDADWTTLENFQIASDYFFERTPGGVRNYYGSGSFNSIGDIGWWWSSTESDGDYSWFSNMGSVRGGGDSKRYGFSVLCVRD